MDKSTVLFSHNKIIKKKEWTTIFNNMLGSQESNTEWDKATQGKMYKVYYRLFKVKKKMT